MEAVRETLAKFGKAWTPDVPPALLKVYEPLQAQQNAKYGSDIQTEKALKYGPDDRNRIDVYSPASGTSGRPVVVYFHGGGLVGGDNDHTPNIYANIGNYFTKHGCITCLATYRLALKTGHHPNGAEDVQAALQWVQANIQRYGGDPSKVVAMGQSAGGVHLLTALFLGYLDPNPKPLAAGLVSLSGVFTMDDSDPQRVKALASWFRAENTFEVNGRWGPLALFRQQYFGTATTPPRGVFPYKLKMLVGEFEADEILDGTFAFVHEHRKRFGRLPLLEVLEGHNHVSYCFGLGLEDPIHEAVGKKLLGYVEEFTQ
ncbi:alpha/beta-hydrolase [Cryphonectria parasitica EP155]|uniref:Alpha/beta-hydrolase n=1 Tax=Cryphonectria parasitica (strain ATCC 38755 / EP155) TaxID=660469 RepID=A0A9P4Y5W0_CRYP1|nr:alpha/beta-hydrolase [Cryphonectria parasitica EP155]KAF3767024.1 alpha/beta-hydrolase [Cryphonectria parasitica EP155]